MAIEIPDEMLAPVKLAGITGRGAVWTEPEYDAMEDAGEREFIETVKNTKGRAVFEWREDDAMALRDACQAEAPVGFEWSRTGGPGDPVYRCDVLLTELEEIDPHGESAEIRVEFVAVSKAKRKEDGPRPATDKAVADHVHGCVASLNRALAEAAERGLYVTQDIVEATQHSDRAPCYLLTVTIERREEL